MHHGEANIAAHDLDLHGGGLNRMSYKEETPGEKQTFGDAALFLFILVFNQNVRIHSSYK